MTDISKKDVTKRSRNGRAIKSLVSAGGISPSGGAGSGGFWVKNDVGISYSGYDDGAGGITPANVGIGTDSPTYKLTVIGSAYVENLYVNSGYNIYMQDSRTSATSGTTFTMGTKFSDYSGEMASIMAIHNGYFGHNARKLQFTVSGSKAMTIDNFGKVGIGTTAPQSKLTIHSNGLGGLEGVQLRNTNYPLVYLYEGSANDGSIQLLSGGAAKVLINSLGNTYFNGGAVGIGTSTPRYTLDIVGSTHTYMNLDAGAGGNAAYMFSSDGALNMQMGVTATNTMYFHSYTVGASVLSILANGAVGIAGSTTPEHTFQVGATPLAATDVGSLPDTTYRMAVFGAQAIMYRGAAYSDSYLANNLSYSGGAWRSAVVGYRGSVIAQTNGQTTFYCTQESLTVGAAVTPVTIMMLTSDRAITFRSGVKFWFPTTDGTSGQILTTNGSGTLYWSSGGGGTPSTGITSINSQAQSAQFIEVSGSLSISSVSGTHTISHLTTAGNKHIPTGGASGQYLRYSASGTATWNGIAANEVAPRAFVTVNLSTTTYNWNVTTTRNIYDAIIGSGAIPINVSTMASGEVGVCRFKTGASATNLVLSYTGGTVMIDSGANLNLSTNTEYVLTVVHTGESKLRFNLAKYVAV